jgi:hypothetical protein
MDILQSIVSGDIPSPTKIVPDYSKELEAIVLRALERDRERRYQTTQELQDDLERLIARRSLSVSTRRLELYMEELFRADVQAWRHARDHGQSLLDFVTRASHVIETSDIGEVARPKGRVRDRRPLVVGGAGLLLALALILGLWGATSRETAPSVSPVTAQTKESVARSPEQEAATVKEQPFFESARPRARAERAIKKPKPKLKGKPKRPRAPGYTRAEDL